MNRPLLFWAGLAAGACAGAEPVEEQAAAGIPIDSTLPAIAAPTGTIAFRTKHPKSEYLVTAVSSVDAIRCPMFGTVHTLVFEETFSLALFVGLRDSAAGGEYEVLRERTGVPDPGTARGALQIYPGDETYSMPAVDGVVTIDSVTDGVWGVFELGVFESVFVDSVVVEGAINGLPVVEGDTDQCRVLGDPPDSLVAGSS